MTQEPTDKAKDIDAREEQIETDTKKEIETKLKSTGAVGKTTLRGFSLACMSKTAGSRPRMIFGILVRLSNASMLMKTIQCMRSS
jgi:hypothetical protein